MFKNQNPFWITGLQFISRLLNEQETTPLNRAAYKNAIEIGELLISKGADINTKDIIYIITKGILIMNGFLYQ